MFLKILLNSLLFGSLLFPAQTGQSGIVPTLNEDNHVIYQKTEHYLPVIPDKYVIQVNSSDSLGIVTSSDSVIVIDNASGHVLFQKNPGRLHSIASLTKLMTAYLFLQQDYDFDKVIDISINTRQDPEESTLNVQKGEKVTVYDLWHAALIGSANNATRELVASLGYSEEEFVNLMNEKADQLGMGETVFVDDTGMAVGNKSTAADYIKLVRLAFASEKIRDATTRTEHRFRSVSGSDHYIKNSNQLLGGDLDIIAGKTGFTYEAGYCLALDVQQDGHEIIILSLGSDTSQNRFSEVRNLASWTFANYQWD